ncbi:MAG TPA: hypothetical protein VMF52_20125 [Steroidobacteraceae bacterium]|nr:hypothetical protein [Steroidobacteraceae bacterium]
MSESTAGQRRKLLGIAIATSLLFAVVVASLAIGGRRDPPALRAAATLLDGAWQFRTGDDPAWGKFAAADTGWETIDLTAVPGSHDGDVGLPDYVAGWLARGHAGYGGYAWYRRAVSIPAGTTAWDILGPTLVEDGYELYWNGEQLGGSGRLGATPRLVGTRPMKFELPADAAGARGVLAIRVYMRPGDGRGADGGGLHTPPLLAPRPVGDALHRAQWQRTVAGYIVDAIEPLAMVGVIGLMVVGARRGGHKAFLVFAGIALALTAERRLNNAIVAWTDLQDLATYSWLASVMWLPTIAAWTLAWNRWCLPAWRSVDWAAAVLGVAGLAGVLMHSDVMKSGSRWASLVLLVVVGVRIAAGGRRQMLAVVTLVTILLAVFGGELLDPLGVPGIWFPFGIGVSRTQYVYAIVIPLLAALVVTRPDGDLART